MNTKVLGTNNLPNELHRTTENDQFISSEQQTEECNESKNLNDNQ